MRSPVVVSISCALALAGCPKPPGQITPTLPGDGTANTAKPGQPTGDKTPDEWAGRTDLIQTPPAQPPSRLELPPIDRFTLTNGLQVVVIKNDRLPTVSMQLAIKAGRGDEPRARLGIAEFTANMLVKGTKRRNALAIAKAIDFVGGTMTADASFEATLVTCSVMSRDLATCLQLLPEVVAMPSFPTAEIPKMRELMVVGVRQRLDDAGQLASVHLQNLLWGSDHVRGWVVDEAALAAITQKDMIAWHKAWFSPSNAMLVVAGDVDAVKIKTDLQRVFGTWRKTKVAPRPRHVQPKLSGSKIRLVDKPGQTQTHIRIGQYGIAHTDPRFFDSLVWNYALGGGVFSSRLMKVVRSEGGKTYGASSMFDRNLDRGSFVAATSTRNSEAVATARLVLAEIQKMHDGGPSEGEVADAVANLAGSHALKFQSAGDLAGAMLAAELHGFKEQYLADFALAVGKVEVASAKAAAAEILDPRNFVVVMVGDAKDLEPQLVAAGWKFTKVSFTDPITAPLEAPQPTADPKAVETAKALLDEALVVKGGEKRLKAIKSIVLAAKGTTAMQGQSVPIEMGRTQVMPDKIRVDISVAGGQLTLEVGIDGKSGWQRQSLTGPDGKPQTQLDDIPKDQLGEAAVDRWRDPELVLLRHKEGAKITPLPDDSIDGKPHAVIRLADGPVNVDLYIDKKTKLVSRMMYDSVDAGPDGKPRRVRLIDDLGGYKDVSGIKVAHTRSSRGGTRSTTYTITKMEFDGAVDPKIFSKPAK